MYNKLQLGLKLSCKDNFRSMELNVFTAIFVS
jgi:hypothetical protein